MSATASVLRIPVQDRSALKLPSFAAVAGSVANFFRARWVYHSTFARLEGCSERVLQDIGAVHGVEEFARRAAGL
jgi:hypothetical protein